MTESRGARQWRRMNRAFAVTAVLLTGCPPLVRPQLRYVHPGIAQLLRLAGDQLPLAEFAALLALDPSDTLRGGNLEVSLFASDLTLRELMPRALEPRRSATKRAGSTATLTTRGGPSAAGSSTAAFGPPSRSRRLRSLREPKSYWSAPSRSCASCRPARRRAANRRRSRSLRDPRPNGGAPAGSRREAG